MRMAASLKVDNHEEGSVTFSCFTLHRIQIGGKKEMAGKSWGVRTICFSLVYSKVCSKVLKYGKDGWKRGPAGFVGDRTVELFTQPKFQTCQKSDPIVPELERQLFSRFNGHHDAALLHDKRQPIGQELDPNLKPDRAKMVHWLSGFTYPKKPLGASVNTQFQTSIFLENNSWQLWYPEKNLPPDITLQTPLPLLFSVLMTTMRQNQLKRSDSTP